MSQTRLKQLDSLRGIAVLGILIMNLPYLFMLEYGYVNPVTIPISDHFAEFVEVVFFDGRFRTLLCLLLGAGIAIQINKHGEKAHQLLNHKYKLLAGIGLVHGVFLFAGDILLSYGLATLFMLTYLLKDGPLLKRGILFFVIGVVTMGIFGLLESPVINRESEEFIEAYTHWQEGYGIQFLTQLVFTLFVTLFVFPFSTLWYVGGLILIGAYLYKHNYFATGFSTKQLSLFAFSWLVLSLIDFTVRQFVNNQTLGMVIASFSALFAALIIIHLCAKFSQLLDPLFAAVGQLSLSIYLLQSIVIGLLARFAWPDFYLSATRLDYILLWLAISVFTIILANGYRKLGLVGPFEKIWQTLNLTKNS
jgi:uncharacterized protein